MISLILVVCLSATPDICREERPPIEIASPMVCLIQGQQIAVQWLDPAVRLMALKRAISCAATQVG